MGGKAAAAILNNETRSHLVTAPVNPLRNFTAIARAVRDVDGAADNADRDHVPPALDHHLRLEPGSAVHLGGLGHDVNHVVRLLQRCLVVIEVVGRDEVAAIVGNLSAEARAAVQRAVVAVIRIR